MAKYRVTAFDVGSNVFDVFDCKKYNNSLPPLGEGFYTLY